MTLDELNYQCEDNTIPYNEKIVTENIVIRHFKADIPEHLLKWHWDDEDRIVEVLNDNDWRFQMDNQIPIKLVSGHIINIPKGEYHRAIKGTTDLIVKITKINQDI